VVERGSSEALQQRSDEKRRKKARKKREREREKAGAI
jgi:hypothetical protein